MVLVMESSARIFETFAKWPAGSNFLAFASALRYFGKRDECLPADPTKGFVVAEEGLFKKKKKYSVQS